MKRYFSMIILLVSSLVITQIVKADTTYQIGEITYTVPYGYEPLRSFTPKGTNQQIRLYINNEDQSLLTIIYQDKNKILTLEQQSQKLLDSQSINKYQPNTQYQNPTQSQTKNQAQSEPQLQSPNQSTDLAKDKNQSKDLKQTKDSNQSTNQVQVNTQANNQDSTSSNLSSSHLISLIQGLKDNYDQTVDQVKTFIIDWTTRLNVHNIEVNQVYRYKIQSDNPGFIALGTAELPNIGKVYFTSGFVANSSYLLNVITYSFSQNSETVGNVLDSLNEE